MDKKEIALKTIYGFIIATIIVLLLWTIASYIEVFTKNVTENPTYSEWNLLNILVENFNK